METRYDGVLVMPKGYTTVTSDEMEYLNGGVRVEFKWYGFNVYLTNSETKGVCTGWKFINRLGIPSVAKYAIKGLSFTFKRANKGRGVKFRMTRFGGNYIITGVWGQ